MIGVMKAMGSTDQQLQQIFINMTQRLVIKGLIIGNIIGLSILLLQSQYHILPLDPESYYLSYVPVKINALHIILLNMGVIAISYMTLILPSKLVAKINPAQTIRYE
jgi:lipoprotein-releasing system permease protein